MKKLNPNDVERIYSDLAQPNQVLLSAVGDVLFAIFQGVQETTKATIRAELQKVQQNQNSKEQ
ncbi:MAG: hypothetical protein NC177_18410 [Ruminococcus flavefaciens]|nr:hypothetical protein [Ruminococcus flavefaciens]